MQNLLAVFLFVIMNFFAQVVLHFIPFVKLAFPSMKSILHIFNLLLFNTSIGVIMYDVFYPVGSVKNVLYFLTFGLLVFSCQEIIKQSYMVFIILIIGIMIAIAYFLCEFRNDLEIKPCLACDRSQELMMSGWYFNPSRDRVH